MNKYYLQARVFPTVLTSVPLLFLIYGIGTEYFADYLVDYSKVFTVLGSIGIFGAVTFLFVQINRTISKVFFQFAFFEKDESFMPTTNSLLWSNDDIPLTVKEMLHNKILVKHSIHLPDAQQELFNESNSRKVIVTAVSQIRISLQGNKMVYQHNIEYGFIRNFIGGCLPAISFSIVVLLYGYHNDMKPLINTGIAFFVIYLLPVLLSKSIIDNYAKNYSKILFDQYLSLP